MDAVRLLVTAGCDINSRDEVSVVSVLQQIFFCHAQLLMDHGKVDWDVRSLNTCSNVSCELFVFMSLYHFCAVLLPVPLLMDVLFSAAFVYERIR